MSLLTKALPCKHELNKYFLKNNEKKNGGTLARTAPHAQGLGQQYCKLKEMQGHMTENSLVNTAGLNTVVHFREKKNKTRQAKKRCRRSFYCNIIANWNTYFTFLCVPGRKESDLLSSCSFCPVLLLLFYHI